MDKQQIMDEPEQDLADQDSLQGEDIYTGPFSHMNFTAKAIHAQNLRQARANPGARTFKNIPLKFKIIGAALALLLIASVVAATTWYSRLPVASVVYQLGDKQQVSQDIGGGGLVFPRQQFDLSYPAVGRVLRMMVKAGDQVKPNQPLLRLDPSQIDSAVNQASSDVAVAQNYLNSVYATGNPVTIAQAQQSLQVAQNKYNALVSQASSLTFHDGLLVSPMNGVVTNININAGEIFTAGSVLLTIMDLSTVTVQAKIPLSEINQVHVGLTALVTPSALPDLNMSGLVTSIIPQADPQTDTFLALVEIAKPQQQILPGMSAFVRIQVPTKAYVVPRLAVLNPDHEAVVFVVRNSVGSIQHVQVIGRSASNIYIEGNIAPGDAIVIRPLDSLHDGQAVTVKQVVSEQ